MVKMAVFETLKSSKNDFTLNLSGRKFVIFPHCDPNACYSLIYCLNNPTISTVFFVKPVDFNAGYSLWGARFILLDWTLKYYVWQRQKYLIEFITLVTGIVACWQTPPTSGVNIAFFLIGSILCSFFIGQR